MTLVHHRLGFPSVDPGSGYPERDRWKPLPFFRQGPFCRRRSSSQQSASV